MVKESQDSVQVDCVESFDGGLPQGFLLELVEVPSLRLVRNMSLLVSYTSPPLLLRPLASILLFIFGSVFFANKV